MKNNRKKVLSAGIGYTLGNYLIKGMSVLTLPIFTRMLTTSDYGIYNSFSAYSGFLLIIMGFAIHSSYRNAKLKYSLEEEYQEYISSTMILLIISFIIWIVLGVFGGEYMVNLLGINKKTILILIVYSFSLAVITCFNSYASIFYKYQAFLLIAGINAVGSILLSILFIKKFYKNQAYMGRVLGTAIPSILIAIFIIIYFIKIAKPKINQIVSKLAWGIKYSLPIIPHGVSQLILSQFDRVMILKMIGSSSAGIYSFAYNIFSIIVVTTTSLDNVWSTWFYEKMHNNDIASIKKYSSLYVVGVLIYSILIMLLSPELIRILGTKEYSDAVYTVIPLVTGGFFSFMYTLPATVEYFYEKTKYIMLGTVISGIINVVLNLIFIVRYGYIAAAYTTMVTYIIYFLLHYIIASKISKDKLFSTKVLVFVSITIIVMNFITIILINHSLIRYMIASIIIICLSIVIFYLFVNSKKAKKGE